MASLQHKTDMVKAQNQHTALPSCQLLSSPQSIRHFLPFPSTLLGILFSWLTFNDMESVAQVKDVVDDHTKAAKGWGAGESNGIRWETSEDEFRSNAIQVLSFPICSSQQRT
jgi:hypothetical protein